MRKNILLLILLIASIGCASATTFTFDDNQIPADWTAYGGTWVVTDGVLLPTNADAHTILQSDISDVGNYEITARIRLIDDSGNYEYSYGGFATKSNTLTDFFACYFFNYANSVVTGGVNVKKMESSAWSTIIEETDRSIITDQWYILKVVKTGNEHKVYLNDVLITTQTSTMPDGYISLYSYKNGCEIDWVEIINTDELHISNFAITPSEYIHADEDITISYDATQSHTLSVTDGTDTWNKICDLGSNTVVFPTDFSGAIMSTVGEYTINFIEDETTIETQTFDVKETPLVTIVSATDMHYQSSDWFGVSSTNQINDFVTNINDETWFSQPDAVFIVGDHLYNPADFGTYKALIDNLEPTYYPITGNHDNGELDYPEAENEKGKLYYEAFGEAYDYKVSINDVDFICTGSDMNYPNLVGTHGMSIGNENNLNWLNETISPEKTTIVFNHFTLDKQRDNGGLENFWEGEWDNNVMSTGYHNMTTALPIQEVLENKHVELAIGGHSHIVSKSEKNNVTYIISGCMQQSPYNFRYIEIYEDTIEVHTIFKSDDAFNHYIIEPHTDSTHTGSYEYFRGLESEQDFTINVNNGELIEQTTPTTSSSGRSSYVPSVEETVNEETVNEETVNSNNLNIINNNSSEENNNYIYYGIIGIFILTIIYYFKRKNN